MLSAGVRRLTLAVLGTALILTACAQAKLNVLFIAVDDLRTELACYGAGHIKSPNLDRLAGAGLLFNRAYCQQAVCSPSRTSLMTGARPDTTRVYDLDTHFRSTIPDVVTLSQQFIKHGYFAQGMGKIFHGGLNDAKSWSVPWTSGSKPPTPALPRMNGYMTQANIELLRADVAESNRKRREMRAKLGRQLKHSEGRKFRVRGPAYEAPDVPDAQTPDGAVARNGVKALKELKKKGQPFFLAVGFLKPHLPFIAPKKYWDMYKRSEIELADNPYAPKGAPPWTLSNYGELRNYRGIPQGREKIPDELAITLRHGYYACVSFIDAQVGLLVKTLDELGLADDTIVILWGDHGWKLGEHGEWCKHTNYENDTRVPMVIKVPGMKAAGKKTDALVEFVDIYPSLCDLCEIPLPAHLEGTSFAPLIDNPNRPWKKAAMSQYPRGYQRKPMMGYTLRTKRYRFVEWLKRGVDPSKAPPGPVELYDHDKDPAENRNIAEAPANAKTVTELRKLLRAGWRAALPPE